MVVIQCKDGDLEIGDWVLHSILCVDLIKTQRKWLHTHSKEEVATELRELSMK